MKNLRVLTVLIFVSLAMAFGSCAEDDSLTEIENNIEATYDGDDDGPNSGDMSNSDGDDDDPNSGEM